MTLMATNAKARLAAMHARGRATLEARTTAELCDMYVLAIAQRNKSVGDEFRAACITLGWIGEVLESRNPAAAARWYEAEEAIETELISREEWTAGASDLPPHPFFAPGEDGDLASCEDCLCCSFNQCASGECPRNSVGESVCPCTGP